MNSLISLDLDFNIFGDNLERGRLDGLNTLQELNLRGNGMTGPPKGALSSLQSLRHLRLDYNNFTRLERKAFGRLPVVFNLSLSHNQINNISMNAFEGLLQLINLDLSYNNLSYIPPVLFKPALRWEKSTWATTNWRNLRTKLTGCLTTVSASDHWISHSTKFPSSPRKCSQSLAGFPTNWRRLIWATTACPSWPTVFWGEPPTWGSSTSPTTSSTTWGSTCWVTWPGWRAWTCHTTSWRMTSWELTGERRPLEFLHLNYLAATINQNYRANKHL